MELTLDLSKILRLLGLATAAFGVGPIVAPRGFARLFGLAYDDTRPSSNMPIRSVGIRDLVTGIGLLAASGDPRRARLWLAIRVSADGGDALTSLAGIRGEPRNYRLMALATIAAGATLTDLALLIASARGNPAERKETASE